MVRRPRPVGSRAKRVRGPRGRRYVVLKLGGELLERTERLDTLARDILALAEPASLVVVHGGGREVDTALARHGLKKRSVDGIRITDEATLAVVIAVLAGTVNTRLVAAIVGHGGRAVGLTGADAALGLVTAAPPYEAADGRRVDLGRVGRPARTDSPPLLVDLCRAGYVPVVASIGISRTGDLFNVNADTLAGHLAGVLQAERLIVAGGTPGVLDSRGRTIRQIDDTGVDRLIGAGHASAGMVAKLAACRQALEAGVGDVVIIDGRRKIGPEGTRHTRIVGTRGDSAAGRVAPVRTRVGRKSGATKTGRRKS